MTTSKSEQPAIEGWFEGSGGKAYLLGSRCKSCGAVSFPPETFYCKNPACSGSDFEHTPLSTRGKLWSFTNSCYKPPAPYVAGDPFVPYIVAAVELEKEKMVVLGQVVPGVAIEELRVGMEMSLVSAELFSDEDSSYTIWKWQPAGAVQEN